MIKVVICDGDGTLQLPNPSTEIKQLVTFLQSSGIKLAVASNNSENAVEKNFQRAGLTLPNIIVSSERMGAKKPSPKFVYEIQNLANIELNEMCYLGDDDKTDMFCAVNAGILPLAAKYSNRSMKYGLSINSVKELHNYLETFGRQEPPYFGWTYSTSCRDTGSDIAVRVLLGNHNGLTPILRTILKNQKDVPISSGSNVYISYILFHYFVSQCYFSNLIKDIDWITVYPGHEQESLNPVLKAFSKYIAQMFRDKFIPDLIVRHQNAPKSQFQGDQRNIVDQFRTVHLKSSYREKIKHKTILVLDDFTTCGYSLETARRMLLQADADKVVCLAMAKFRNTHAFTRINESWDPFSPCEWSNKKIRVIDGYGHFNNSTDEYFKNNIWEYYKSV